MSQASTDIQQNSDEQNDLDRRIESLLAEMDAATREIREELDGADAMRDEPVSGSHDGAAANRHDTPLTADDLDAFDDPTHPEAEDASDPGTAAPSESALDAELDALMSAGLVSANQAPQAREHEQCPAAPQSEQGEFDDDAFDSIEDLQAGPAEDARIDVPPSVPEDADFAEQPAITSETEPGSAAARVEEEADDIGASIDELLNPRATPDSSIASDAFAAPESLIESEPAPKDHSVAAPVDDSAGTIGEVEDDGLADAIDQELQERSETVGAALDAAESRPTAVAETATPSPALQAVSAGPGQTSAGRLRLLAAQFGSRTLGWSGRVMEFLPPHVRDYLGWFGLITLFSAVCVWVAVMLRG